MKDALKELDSNINLLSFFYTWFFNSQIKSKYWCRTWFVRAKASSIWIRPLYNTTKHKPILMFAEGLRKYCDRILGNHHGNLLNIDWKTTLYVSRLFIKMKRRIYCFRNCCTTLTQFSSKRNLNELNCTNEITSIKEFFCTATNSDDMGWYFFLQTKPLELRQARP